MKRLTFILMMVLLAVSCERKILLEPGHQHGDQVFISIDVDVEIDAEVETGGDPDMYKSILRTARSLTVVAYPLDKDGHFGIHKISGLEGTIWLMPGKYDLLLYTSDFHELDGLYYRGMTDIRTAESYTYQVKSSKTKAAVKSYDIDEPDPLFVHYYKEFEVVEGENKLEAGLQPMAYKYWYEVDVDGLDYITSAWLEVDGMYTSVFMADESHRDDEYGTQRVESTIHKDENKIKGEFFSFGPHQDSNVKNSIIITFINGRTIRVKMDDISPEIKKLRKGGEIVIEQKIVINVDDTGSGFVPNVSDWEEEEVEIPI